MIIFNFLKETTLASTSATAKEEISNSLKLRECQNGKLAEDVAAVHGVKIRRRPPTGPSKHYVGPFEFRLENEGNTPRNILEKIIWDKDFEVTQAISDLTYDYLFYYSFLIGEC